MLPWEYCSDLTRDRLIKVAQLLARGRQEAVDRHDPTIGGDAWTRGVCAYRFACHQIQLSAGTPGFEWLTVVDAGKRFQFRIGATLLRFWRGDPQDPTERIATATEFEQHVLPLEDGFPLAGVVFRIGIESDYDGALLSASFVALRHKQVEAIWLIPLADAPPLLVTLEETRPAGRELSAPFIVLTDDDEIGDQDNAIAD